MHAVIGIGATEHVLQQQWPRPLDSALRSGAERVAKHCDADHACWTAAERVGENLQLGFAHTRARARMQLDTVAERARPSSFGFSSRVVVKGYRTVRGHAVQLHFLVRTVACADASAVYPPPRARLALRPRPRCR